MRASLTLMLREPWARVLPLVFSKALDTTSAHRRTLVVQADKTGSDLIYALTELRSSRGRVSRESFRHIVRTGFPRRNSRFLNCGLPRLSREQISPSMTAFAEGGNRRLILLVQRMRQTDVRCVTATERDRSQSR